MNVKRLTAAALLTVAIAVSALTGTAAAAEATSTASTNQAAVTAPEAPKLRDVYVGNSKATATWMEPGTDGGAAITQYTAVARLDGQAASKCNTGADGQACTLQGLKNGVLYTVTVTAANRVGTSPASTATFITPN